MTEEEILALLEQLKVLTEETDESAAASPILVRMFTDDQLRTLLEFYAYDLRTTAYNVLLRKAKNTGVRLASGLTLQDNSAYWLRLAAAQRPNKTGTRLRLDEPEVDA